MDCPATLVVASSADLASTLCGRLAQAGFEGPVQTTSYPDPQLLSRLVADLPAEAAALIDFSDDAAGFRALAAIRKARPDTLTIVVNAKPRLSTIVRAKQAGAWGWLEPPYEMQSLAEAFGMKVPERVVPDEPAKLLSIIPAKGGNGASTVAIHLAAAIASKLSGTLLADLDIHNGAVAFQLGIEPNESLTRALESDPLELSRVEPLLDRWRDLTVLVAPPDRIDVSLRIASRTPEIVQALRGAHRCVVADHPAVMLGATLDILTASDLVCIVCTPEVTSLHLAKRKVQQCRDGGVDLDRLRVLVNRVGAWGGLDLRHLERLVGLPVTWALDNDYRAVRRAAWEGGLIAPDSALAAQLSELGERLGEELGLTRRAAEGSAEAMTAAV
jgi:pilus assembly protein CpaE